MNEFSGEVIDNRSDENRGNQNETNISSTGEPNYQATDYSSKNFLK